VLSGLTRYQFRDSASLHSSQGSADVRLIAAVELLCYLPRGHPFLGVHTGRHGDLLLQGSEVGILDGELRLSGQDLALKLLCEFDGGGTDRSEEPGKRIPG